MIIISSSLIIHTFLNIATAAIGIIPTIDVLYVCMYVCMYIYACSVYVCIWVHVHTKTRYLLNFCCNNLSKPTLLSNYEILHYDFKAFVLSGLDSI